MSTSKVKLTTAIDAACTEVNDFNEIIMPSMCQEEYHDILDYFYQHNGFLTKCLDEYGKIKGFLVRVECPFNRDYIFINYRPVNINSYNFNPSFEKSIAIIQTFKKGIRFYKKNTNLENISFDKYIIDLKDTIISCSHFNIGSLPDFLQKNMGFDYDMLTDVKLANNNLIISDNLYEYMKAFEKKAKKYYKNNVNKKTFIALPI